ncbi:MAG: MAPEG family protein [Sphingomonadaceae bacterium]
MPVVPAHVGKETVLAIVSTTAALLALILVGLSLRVSAVRRSAGVSVGDGGNPLLLARIRAHANFVEYVPIALILLLLVEQQAGSGALAPALGAILVVSHLLHPIGMERPAPNLFRVAGTLGTWVVLVVLAGALLAGVFSR